MRFKYDISTCVPTSKILDLPMTLGRGYNAFSDLLSTVLAMILGNDKARESSPVVTDGRVIRHCCKRKQVQELVNAVIREIPIRSAM